MDALYFLHYAFIQKAFLAGSFIAVTCAVLGIFLVLRKMSLIGDGLAHVSFGAIALGLFFSVYPFYIATPLVMISAVAIIKITEKTRVYGDAAIGIISAIGIAGGIILASVSNGFNIDLFSYLFGNILAISTTEVILSIILSFIVLVIMYFFYWDLFSTTFDESYAKTTGIKTETINTILAILTAVTVVLSIKVVGVMLISALLIIPAITALQIANGFIQAIIYATVFSLLSVLSGITLSFFIDLPAGATIVMINAFFFFITLFYKKIIQ